ncbi:hypothetical protein PPYR_06120 [Photinus pyralis]|uniref:Uncharacterized protein n=1 Tax=Photinus pyralis TaxID=7054 RepID=A0A5N4AT33_PHOPY|nr:hypothetical protein PPYR_06120 [Photinus pyralis]
MIAGATEETCKKASETALPVSRLAGRLKNVYSSWLSITKTSTVLSWIKGIYIPFLKVSTTVLVKWELTWSQTALINLQKALADLLKLGAISRVSSCSGQFIWNNFSETVPRFR